MGGIKEGRLQEILTFAYQLPLVYIEQTLTSTEISISGNSEEKKIYKDQNDFKKKGITFFFFFSLYIMSERKLCCMLP